MHKATVNQYQKLFFFTDILDIIKLDTTARGANVALLHSITAATTYALIHGCLQHGSYCKLISDTLPLDSISMSTKFKLLSGNWKTFPLSLGLSHYIFATVDYKLFMESPTKKRKDSSKRTNFSSKDEQFETLQILVQKILEQYIPPGNPSAIEELPRLYGNRIKAKYAESLTVLGVYSKALAQSLGEDMIQFNLKESNRNPNIANDEERICHIHACNDEFLNLVVKDGGSVLKFLPTTSTTVRISVFPEFFPSWFINLVSDTNIIKKGIDMVLHPLRVKEMQKKRNETIRLERLYGLYFELDCTNKNQASYEFPPQNVIEFIYIILVFAHYYGRDVTQADDVNLLNRIQQCIDNPDSIATIVIDLMADLPMLLAVFLDYTKHILDPASRFFTTRFDNTLMSKYSQMIGK